MHIATSMLLMLSGATAVISCGDNWHLGADAAVDAPTTADAAPLCGCPATEPPIAGRFVVVSNVRTIPASDLSYEFATCPMGAQLISGSCVVDNATMRFKVSIEQSGFHPVAGLGWECAFHNYEPVPVPYRVLSLCLKRPL